MMLVERDAETVSYVSADAALDRIAIGGSRGRRNGGCDAGGRSAWHNCACGDAGLSGRRGRGRRGGLAEATQSERNRAEAGKKRCFHKYPFAVRCSGGRIWIQKKESDGAIPSAVATALWAVSFSAAETAHRAVATTRQRHTRQKPCVRRSSGH